jgi:hypothetical protein
MPEEQSKSLDILGIKPIAESLNKVTTAAVDGSAAFLSRICLPAAEEFGLLLRDRVRGWRAANIAAITKRAEEKLAQQNESPDVHAHPRIVSTIVEEGSWIEDPVVQDMWAGLLSSSCTEAGDDDSNLIFVNLLASFTKLQARILDYACSNARKQALPNLDLIQAQYLSVSPDALREITGVTDIQRLDRELDHLRELGLIDGGFQAYHQNVELTPTALALHLYVRCQGSRASPADYFKVEIQSDKQKPPGQ